MPAAIVTLVPRKLMFLVLIKSLATTLRSPPATRLTLPLLEPMVLPVRVVCDMVPL
ncbi:hypothetical protein D3C84_550570 [compost metagenome]